METNTPRSRCQCTAFEGSRLLTHGEFAEVAATIKEKIGSCDQTSILIFDDATGAVLDVDYRGTKSDVLRRLESDGSIEPSSTINNIHSEDRRQSRGPGRPKLGVVAREVTLLPRHWEWLNQQPGGASVALRKLVEEAKRENKEIESKRQAQEAAYRFMSAMAGNRSGFEEATRALFKSDQARFDELIQCWPADIRAHVQKLSARVFAR